MTAPVRRTAISFSIILLVAALVLFIIAALLLFGVFNGTSIGTDLGLVALGLACWVGAAIAT